MTSNLIALAFNPAENRYQPSLLDGQRVVLDHDLDLGGVELVGAAAARLEDLHRGRSLRDRSLKESVARSKTAPSCSSPL